ncbi:MAG: saccharopine dehydrogenase NADP-binding domain-containing protein [Chloroflexota bacterium]
MDKPFDIVLWGATGFTGQLVAEYLAKQADTAVKWAIAGRSQNKLEATQRKLSTINPELKDLPILVGDSLNKASLEAIVSQTKVLCTTVGPYAKYGDLLVEVCVEQGVDYCDLTGEVPWIRKNVESFHEKAQANGARIVHCCGFDSIPSDLGNLMLQEHAQAEYGRPCETVKFAVYSSSGGVSGGTVASLLEIVKEAGKSKEYRKMLANPYNLVPGRKPDWSQTDQTGANYDDDFGFWTGPFVMAGINTRIVRRSNYLLGNPWGEDFKYSETMRIPGGVTGRLGAYGFSAGYGLFQVLAAIGPTRRILETAVLPKPGEGPSEEARESGYFKIKLLGFVPAQGDDPKIKVDGVVVGQKDPGYGETAKMLGESALCLALDDLQSEGGVLTPASAMGMTLVERLRNAGMTFMVESGPA